MDISSGAAYGPLFTFEEGLSEIQSVFCFDQQKLNMLSLFGDYSIEEIDDLPLAVDIHQYMDKQTREHLRKLPLHFMDYWSSIDNGEAAITKSAPPGYISTMRVRAAKLQRNLLVSDQHENVVTVNFRKTA